MYAGSNPALPTILFRKSVHHHDERFFVLAGLGSNHCRIRISGEAKGLSRSEAKSGELKLPNPALPTIIFRESVHHYDDGRNSRNPPYLADVAESPEDCVGNGLPIS